MLRVLLILALSLDVALCPWLCGRATSTVHAEERAEEHAGGCCRHEEPAQKPDPCEESGHACFCLGNALPKPVDLPDLFLDAGLPALVSPDCCSLALQHTETTAFARDDAATAPSGALLRALLQTFLL